MAPPMTKRETATRLLTGLFAGNERVVIQDAVAAARKLGVSRSTLERAAYLNIGVTEIHNGPYSGFWERKEAA